MAVPLLDLKRQYQPLANQLERALVDTARSTQWIGGEQVERFEAEFADYCGTRRAVAVSSGTDALLAALMALRIGPGDEVVTTPFSFFATAGAIVRLGARPVFVDIEPTTFNLDLNRIADAITDRTRAIMPVHLYGQIGDMAALGELACDRELPIVEDAAQAAGAERDGRRGGAFGLLGCFSFYPTKNLNAMGDAGAITTPDDQLADRLAVLRNHGMNPRYVYRMVGGNFRLDALQAAALRVKLPYLDGWNQARRRLADRYAALLREAGLDDRVQPPVDTTGGGHIYHQYVVRCARRDELQAFLQSRGVGCAVFYPIALHQQEAFADLGYRAGDFPHAERAAAEVLALPMFPELTEAEQVEVVQTIAAFYAGAGG